MTTTHVQDALQEAKQDAHDAGLRYVTDPFVPSTVLNREARPSNTPGGKLVFHVFGVLAEFERDLVKERTQAGLAAALALYHSRKVPVAEICQTLGVSRTSLYRLVGQQTRSQQVGGASNAPPK